MHLATQARAARPPLPLRVGPHESQAFSMLTYFYGAKHPPVCPPPPLQPPHPCAVTEMSAGEGTHSGNLNFTGLNARLQVLSW